MKSNKLILYFVLLLIITIVYSIVIKNLVFSTIHSTDLINHIRFAQKLLSYSLEHRIYFIPHPLFHILLICFQFVFGSWELSSFILLLLFIIIMYNVQIYYISKVINSGFLNTVSIVMSFILLIVSSVYIPFINNWLSPEYFNVMFSGSGTPNVLHNPTYYLIKLFVLPVFFLALIILENKLTNNRKSKLLFILLLSISILAKPNFALSIIPAFVIIFLIKFLRPHNHFWKVILHLTILLTIPVIILFMQFLISYLVGPRDSTVSACFFCVWQNWSKFPPASILLGIAFPLYMFMTNIKRNIRDEYYIFAWLNFLFALFFAGFFYETNYRFLAGNFFWGYNLALYLLLFVSLLDFFKTISKEIHDRQLKFKQILACAVLSFHLVGGIYHLSIYMH